MLDEASKQRIKFLCNLIANESDPDRFSRLVKELNQVFDSSESDLQATAEGVTSPADTKSS